jgi:hypothetical protein
MTDTNEPDDRDEDEAIPVVVVDEPEPTDEPKPVDVLGLFCDESVADENGNFPPFAE